MADKSLPNSNADSIDEALHRLSRKPGVKAWLMLDRTSGAVLKTNGQIANIRLPKQTTAAATNNNISSIDSNGNNAADVNPLQMSTARSGSFSADVMSESDIEAQAARELAGLVWSFITATGSLVDEMDSDDELKLLRLRTKKQELVIVPEAKYLLVVSHDTPPA